MTDRDDARQVLSEMIEITEHTIGRTFHRYPDLDALYRAVPTAFWLAPDGDGVLDPPPPGPAMPRPVLREIDDVAIEPVVVDGLAGGIFRSLLAAGPIFAATGMMVVGPGGDDHWWEPFGRALISLVAFPLTITIGALLALLPVLTGVLTLGEVGKHAPIVRARTAWAFTGAAMGVVIAAMFKAGGPIGLALVATSVACAVIARTCIDWTDPEYA